VKLLKARGGFDPKIQTNFRTKEYKDKQYYDLFYTAFKVPTWYGVELQATYQNNSGVYLNPQNTVPDKGIYSAGLSVNALEGLLIDKRMADLKQAKLYIKETSEKQKLMVNDILYQASIAYLDWFKTYLEYSTYTDFLQNAKRRLRAVEQSVKAGSVAAIDSVEATIAVQTRSLKLEEMKLKMYKKKLKVSTYLWDEDLPIEINESIQPLMPLRFNNLSIAPMLKQIEQGFDIENHPKIKALNFKRKVIDINKKLYTNKLLPKLKLTYNFLNSETDVKKLQLGEYKAKINFSTPILLRKERAYLQMSKLKLQDNAIEIQATKLKINNKLQANRYALTSFKKQFGIANEMISNYRRLLAGAEKKYQMGESSLLAINLYEAKLIEGTVKQIATQNKLFGAIVDLYNTSVLMTEL